MVGAGASCADFATMKNRRIILSALLVAVISVTVSADVPERLGEGVAIVFSPDFADPHNRLFYESLGFLYIETPDWSKAVRAVGRHNETGDVPIRVLIVETHGTNGNGLKLQSSPSRLSARSYISIGALQEQMEGAGVEIIVLSACNSGRLLRPEIYNRLNRRNGDPLFLPATLGIVNASEGFDPASSSVRVLRRVQSNLETLLHAETRELDPSVGRALHGEGISWRFAISTMLIQLVTGDESLELTADGYETEKSRDELSARRSEELFRRFGAFLAERVTGEAFSSEDRIAPLVGAALLSSK
jgi:hypothetical protein